MSETRTEPTLRSTPADEIQALDADPALPGPSKRRRRRRMRWTLALLALLMLLAIGALVSVLWQPRPLTRAPDVAPRAEPPPAAVTSKPRFPIESTAEALPPLDASDAAMLAALQTLWQGPGIAPFLESRSLVRNIVATVDNLPRRTLPLNRRPLRPTSGAFATAPAANGPVISDANALRYAPYVRLLESADPNKLVALYARHYPLFEEAYRELGYPQGHFNDRLVEAIDVMLATPQVSTPIRVVQPKVFYEFADEELEQSASGQKLMLRIGPANAKAVKAKLAEIRRILTAQLPEAGGATPKN